MNKIIFQWREIKLPFGESRHGLLILKLGKGQVGVVKVKEKIFLEKDILFFSKKYTCALIYQYKKHTIH